MWDEAHEREAKAIRKLFDSMGGLYNKLAQDWATRDGLVPQAWVDELKHSFEGMPFREWAQMSKMLLRGLEGEGVAPVKNGKGLDAYFKSVDQTPLAAASIGQVHLATTYAGERVVVKAIYPEIRRYLIADLKNARKAVRTRRLNIMKAASTRRATAGPADHLDPQAAHEGHHKRDHGRGGRVLSAGAGSAD
jgi:ubiquinone biosynthesis protein